MNKQPLSFYLNFQRKLEDSCGMDKRMSVQEAESILTFSFRQPKSIRYAILKEMEQMGLIIIESRLTLRLINMDQNKILDNVSKFNKELGIFP